VSAGSRELDRGELEKIIEQDTSLTFTDRRLRARGHHEALKEVRGSATQIFQGVGGFEGCPVRTITTFAGSGTRFSTVPGSSRSCANELAVVAKGPEVAAYVDPLAVDGRAADRPLGGATLARGEVVVVSVVDVGNPLEARHETPPDVGLPREAPAKGDRALRENRRRSRRRRRT
jgi:hypothetical protein